MPREASIHAGVSSLPATGITTTPLGDALRRTRQARTLVESLIADPSLLGPDFTAIRSLTPAADAAERRPPSAAPRLGWQVAARGRPGTAVSDALSLLSEARRLGLVERLDWAFRCHVFDVASAANVDGELHLRPEPETFGSPCPPRLAVSFLRGRRSLAVVAELTEAAFADTDRLRTSVEQMRSWGWQFSYADLQGTAAEQRAIALAATIRPAYQQVDVRRGATGALHETAQAHGATLLAVGVDSPAELERARGLGAAWGCGTLIGLPAPRPI